jgi:hypothetical protein
VKALKNGAALSFRRVKDKLFVTLPSELDESDYVVEVRMR